MTSLEPASVLRRPLNDPLRRRARRRVVAIVSTLAAVVVAVGVVAAVRWRNGLHLFSPVGNEVGAYSLAVGRTLYVGNAFLPGRDRLDIRIYSIRPVVTANTAHARIRVLMCTLPPGLDAALGADYSLRHFCAAVKPFTAATYVLGKGITAGTVSVIVAVTSHSSGHVHVAGVRVVYEQGIRRGDQHTGIEIDTRTPAG